MDTTDTTDTPTNRDASHLKSKKNIFTINNIFYQLNPETWNWKFGKKSRKQTRDNIETETGGWMQIFDMGHEIWLGGLEWQSN